MTTATAVWICIPGRDARDVYPSPPFDELPADIRAPADCRLPSDRLNGVQKGAIAGLGTDAVRGIRQYAEDDESPTACLGIGDERGPGGDLVVEVDLRYGNVGSESVGYLQQLVV